MVSLVLVATYSAYPNNPASKHKLDLTSLSLLIFTALNGYYVFEMTTFFLEYCKSACACRQS